MEALDLIMMGVSMSKPLEISQVMELLVETSNPVLRGISMMRSLGIDLVVGHLERRGDHGHVSRGEWLIPLLICRCSSSY